MLFLSCFLTLFSLTVANILSHGGEVADPSYNSNKYHWECGMTAIINFSDCEKVFSEIRNASTDGLLTISEWPAKVWERKTCKATLQTNYLPRDGLEIRTDELIEVAEWGLKSLCGRSSQRTMVNPQNDDWKLWLTEPSWNRSKPFALYEDRHA
ncbi:hypothetical protein FSARC_5153 [Fusarium sarcochroum]|uniref:Ecp2 effector protein domain-containing protein n=1 Tax=Fusarium sarcochroum TaxID=1208366 RepID=A0A8H4U008_9HYPO|nr:hypothetical protein FSARC_5153 [Fusarium sarcochroum]